MDHSDTYDNEGSPWANSSPGGDDESRSNQRIEKKGNALPLWGNDRTMNLNPLILTNIQSSHYFKVNLYELKTYHEVIDEIYYKVTHLEPWEKGSRRTAGQTGMCGGVRGVGAGGIVSTAYCLLYKLFTLKLTRKQVNGLLTHPDSPYIRGLGFMYIRYTQPPADLWDWYDPYLEDPEDMDVKAGGGQVMTIGDMLRAFLTKLEWFSTLFPRIPVPIQQKLQKKMAERFPPVAAPAKPLMPAPKQVVPAREARHIPDEEVSFGEAERFSRLRGSERERDSKRAHSPVDRDKRRKYDSPNDDKEKRRGHSPEVIRDRKQNHNRERRDKSRDRGKREHSRERDRSRDRERSMKHSSSKDSSRTRDKDREHKKHRSHSDFPDEYAERNHKKHRTYSDYEEIGERDYKKHHSHNDFAEELGREKNRQSKERYRDSGKSKHKHRS